MASTSATYPGTMADDAAVGTVAWTNPNNVKVSDNAYATVANVDATTHYLKATNFGFSIPTGATINGILVEIERKKVRLSPIDNVIDSAIKIVKSNGTIGTTNKSTGASWSTTESFVSFGGASDLWGETWSATDINDADFGVVLSALIIPDSGITASVDSIRMTIYYTEAAASDTTAFFNFI